MDIIRAMALPCSTYLSRLCGGTGLLCFFAAASLGGCDRSQEVITLDPVKMDLPSDPRAYIDRPNIWPSANPLSVCWVSGFEGRDKEISWVREAIERTWERAANIRFTGWGPCAQTLGGADINIYIEDEGPYVLGLGASIRRMLLNFDFEKWGCNGRACNFPEPRRKQVIESIAIHEFGHALGLSHEHNRPDTPSSCRNEPQGPDGDLNFGEWDSISVMNYCSPTPGFTLSNTDKNAVQFMYGAQSAFVFTPQDFISTVDPSTSDRFILSQMPKDAQWLSGDLDGDGNDDLLAIQNKDGQENYLAYTHINQSVLAVPRAQTFSGRVKAQAHVLQDIDGDGKDDLLSVRPSGLATFITAALSAGNMNFATEVRTSLAYSPNLGAQFRFGDTDRDGAAELVLIEPDLDGARISVRRASNGLFELSRVETRIQLDDAPLSRWMIGDATGDRRADLIRITPSASGESLCLHAALGDGRFDQDAQCIPLPIEKGPYKEVLMDVSGDGRLDLVRVRGVADQVRFDTYLGGRDSFFNPRRSYPSLSGFWAEQTWAPLRVRGERRASLVGLW